MQTLITALQDKNLTFKAKGLLAIRVLIPDQYTIQKLAKTSHEGIHASRSIVMELIDKGYVERVAVIRAGEKLPRFGLQVRDEQ